MVVVAILSLDEYDALLHIFVLEFKFALIHQLQYFGVAGHLADVLFAVVLNNEVVVVVALPEGCEFELLHPYEVFVAEAEFILDGWVELVEVAGHPAVLVVRWVEFYFLAADVELVRIVYGDEVDGHDFVPVSEKYCVYKASALILADCLLPVLYLERSNLD